MSSKFFSIITPVFNGVTFIEETIKSIIGQTFKDFEYIIVDGNSTDGTQNIINKHSLKIDKFISEKDDGMYDAIDKGIKLSNGKYILWVNSDDILADKNSLQNLSNYLNKVETQWITGRASYIFENQNKIFNFIPYVYPNVIIKNGLAHDCFWGFIQQESTIFSRELYNRVGGFNKSFKMAGDFDLWKKFSNYTKLTTCNIKIGVQRKWSGQMQKDLNFYYKEIEKKKFIFNFFKLFRFFYSILLYPYIYFKK